jgi:hypothetical protein
MKNICRFSVFTALAFCVLYLGLSAHGPATAQSNESSDMKTAPESSSPLQQQITTAEREGLDALKAGNVDDFASHTAEEAVFVDAHGPASKAQVVKNVSDFRLTDYSMDDIHFVELSPKSGLIVYMITEKGISHGKEFSARAYVSSIWAQQGGKWVCLFSQETGVR